MQIYSQNSVNQDDKTRKTGTVSSESNFLNYSPLNGNYLKPVTVTVIEAHQTTIAPF
jgi:hypothetical protein